MIRVYRYGLLPPIQGAELVRGQIHLAHTYFNRLIELERLRRQRIAQAEADDAIRAIDARLAAKAEPSQPLWAARKLLLLARRKLPEVKAAVLAINDDMRGEVRAARKTCEVYWGSYLQVEAAVEAAAKSPAPPKFREWRGDGSVAVQLQQGMPVPSLLDRQDRRVALDLAATPVPGRGGRPLPRLRLRVGSDGRDPVWAEWPIVYHRPLPLGASLKWAKVVLRRIATREEWSVHFTLDIGRQPNCSPVPAARDLVAVEFGGEGCAGRWSDGERSGAIALPPEIEGAIRKAADLEAIRAKHLEQLRIWLVTRRDDLHRPWPYKLRAQADRMPAWESPARFHAFELWWRHNRHAGDDIDYARLATWSKRDAHLWLWQAHARLRAQRRRRDVFRNSASRLAREYACIVLPETGALAAADVVGAPCELRGVMINAFDREQRAVLTVAATKVSELLAAARARKCSTVPQGPARSMRYNRLRGITPTHA